MNNARGPQDHMTSPRQTSAASGTARPSRRTFVKGLAIGGVVAGLGRWGGATSAQSPRQASGVLSGTDFDLSIGETLVDFTGSPRTAQTINGSLPAPIRAA